MGQNDTGGQIMVLADKILLLIVIGIGVTGLLIADANWPTHMSGVIVQ